jgi:hypothetical protein
MVTGASSSGHSKGWVAIALLSGFVLASCSGEMQGVVRGQGTPVAFAFEQGLESDTLTAVIDGENFRGRSVMTNATSTIGTGFGTVSGAGGLDIFNASLMGMTTSGSFAATMLGDRGSSLRCQLQYASSMGDTSAGGVGVCQHSDGRVIDVQW